MSDETPFPFPQWDGSRTEHLAVCPEGPIYVVPSGGHERLHRILVGDRDPTARLRGGEHVVRGTKVDLALLGWTQLQSDRLTDRINVDAPDGFAEAAIVQRFAALHDAGSACIAFHPSGDVYTATNPQDVSLSHEGDRVPVAFER